MGEDFWVVSIADEALDTKAMDRVIGKGEDCWTEYMRERDPQWVRCKPGERLTRFYLRPIPTSLFNRYVQTAGSESEKFLRAFQCGVSEIRDAPEHMQGGGTLRPTREMSTATGPVLTWGDDEVDSFPPVWAEEIGSIAWARSFLGRTTGRVFQPPPSLVHVLVVRKSRDVVDALEAARQSSGERSSESPQGSESGSGAGTDARAMDSRTAASGGQTLPPT